MKRLIKSHNNGSGYSPGIIVPEIEKKIVDKDKIEDITYNSESINTWDMEINLDNAEWNLQSNF